MRLPALIHLIDAVRALTGCEQVTVAGSAALLAWDPTLGDADGPLEFTRDADLLVVPSDAQVAAIVHEALGEGSLFDAFRLPRRFAATEQHWAAGGSPRWRLSSTGVADFSRHLSGHLHPWPGMRNSALQHTPSSNVHFAGAWHSSDSVQSVSEPGRHTSFLRLQLPYALQ